MPSDDDGAPETDDDPGGAQASEEGTPRPRRAPLAPADPAAYLAHLGLAAASAGPPPALQLSGLLSVPHLRHQQVLELRRWAKSVRARTLPSGLLDALAADASRVPLAQLGQLDGDARALIGAAVCDLRRRIEEENVVWVGRRGWCARQAVAAARRLGADLADLGAAEARCLATLGVGLDALCRAAAMRGWPLEGPRAGAAECQRAGRLLRQARQALRRWLEERPLGSDAGGPPGAPSAASCDPQAGGGAGGPEPPSWPDPRLCEAACAQVAQHMPSASGLSAPVLRQLCIMAVASHEAVRADIARQASGERGERLLADQLAAAGVAREAYYTEDDLRAIQERLFGRTVFATPDILFKDAHLLNGDTFVRWLDSKGSCPLPDFAFNSVVQKLRGQLARFVDLFGPGVVIWRGGFSDAATSGLSGVRAAAWPSDECRSQPEGRGHQLTSVWERWQ